MAPTLSEAIDVELSLKNAEAELASARSSVVLLLEKFTMLSSVGTAFSSISSGAGLVIQRMSVSSVEDQHEALKIFDKELSVLVCNLPKYSKSLSNLNKSCSEAFCIFDAAYGRVSHLNAQFSVVVSKLRNMDPVPQATNEAEREFISNHLTAAVPLSIFGNYHF